MIRTVNLSKAFSGNYVLENVNFHLNKGEIHGLVGANGSGKSTFLNILFQDKNIANTGGYEGEIYFEGKTLDIKNTSQAIDMGIGKVYQEFALIYDMDIAGNIKINTPNIVNSTKVFGNDFSYIDKAKNNEEARAILKELGINIDVNIEINKLSVNTKQFIEIAREISNKNLKLLLLDEPTACLNKEDANIFLQVIKALKDKGITIIFITHRLDEIVEVCDNVTIFRDGNIISQYKREDFDIEKIAIDMIGQRVDKTKRNDEVREFEEIILKFDNCIIHDKTFNIDNFNLDIRKGEIIGITSLAGHGSTSIGEGIMGSLKVSGDIYYKNKKINPHKPDKTIRDGIILIPDERKEKGVLLESSISDNIIFTSCYSKNKFLKYPKLRGLSPLDKNMIDECVDNSIKEFNVKCSSSDQLLRELSGGNQQKVCIARAILTNPSILFVSEPTRGIDIYSKEIILKTLVNINKENETTVVISSSEIDELKRVCDRIIVMYEGKIFDILSPNEDDEVFSLAISGKRRDNNEKN